MYVCVFICILYFTFHPLNLVFCALHITSSMLTFIQPPDVEESKVFHYSIDGTVPYSIIELCYLFVCLYVCVYMYNYGILPSHIFMLI